MPFPTVGAHSPPCLRKFDTGWVKMLENVITAIEIIGVVSFCISGAIVAIDKEMDLMGVVLLALTTTFGGGVFRDLIIGRTPAFFVSMHLYVLVGTVTSIIVFILASAFKRWYVREEAKINFLNNFVDAIGLGAFTVTSVDICLDVCPEKGPFLAIMMGMIASVGGGVVRDLFLDRVPNVFRKHIYALACLIGSALYYVLRVLAFPNSEVGEIISTVVCILTVFVIRVLASIFKWNLPKAIRFAELEEKNG